MKVIISEEQLRKIILNQAQNVNLTYDEQSLLGFLNRFLRGEDGEMDDPNKQTLRFNTRTIYPMALKLLEKKRTGKKTYNDVEFKALVETMKNNIKPGQKELFYEDGGKINNIQYHSRY